jgi:peptide/nickel transport system permease protein
VKLARAVAGPLITLLAGGLLTVWLVRVAPGYNTDASELDGRRSANSVAALRSRNQDTLPVLQAYAHYLVRLGHGDLGTSRAWGLPVEQLLRKRGAVTLGAAGSGLLLGWAVAVGLALAGSCRGLSLVSGVSRSAAASLLCLPSPAVALLLCLWLRRTSPDWRVAAVVGLAVFARVLLASAAVVAAASREPHLLQARARGLSTLRLVLSHVLRRSAPALAALLVAAIPLAFSVSVPVETVCNLPGAGQLAWLAAQKRDLPVLIGLTLALLALTLLSGSVARAVSRTGAGMAERGAL